MLPDMEILIKLDKIIDNIDETRGMKKEEEGKRRKERREEGDT